MTASRIQRWVRSRRLFPVHRGVYSLGPGPLTSRGDWMAATLAVDPSLLSHASAAALWGMLGRRSTRIHVTCGRRTAGVDGIVVHWAGDLPRSDRVIRDRIPVTSATRTLVDLAAIETETTLRRAVAEADRLGMLRLAELTERAAVPQRGVRALRDILADYTGAPPTRSELEALFLDLCRTREIPAPEVNAMVAGIEVDMWWPAAPLVVELDGYAFHSTRAARERDLEREAILHEAGIPLRRFGWRQVTGSPDRVAGMVRAALGLEPGAARSLS